MMRECKWGRTDRVEGVEKRMMHQCMSKTSPVIEGFELASAAKNQLRVSEENLLSNLPLMSIDGSGSSHQWMYKREEALQEQK
jgi:hypothetical protein